MKIKILDHGYIELIENWGSDERIIESARMSTNKGFLGWGGNSCPDCVIEKKLPAHLYDPNCSICKGTGFTSGDEKLLLYLYKNKHMTPFEMAGMIIEVQAPIFVFREWRTHRTQVQVDDEMFWDDSYNEMSARYTELPNLFYIPSIERLQHGRQNTTTNRQGSQYDLELSIAAVHHYQNQIRESLETSRRIYEILIKEKVAKEIARLVIPVAQYSRMRASANLRNWLAFLTLRRDEHAQWEIRQYANVVHEILKEKFPRTIELFDGESNG